MNSESHIKGIVFNLTSELSYAFICIFQDLEILS